MERVQIGFAGTIGLFVAFSMCFAGEAHGEEAAEPVNMVEISDLLTTSGQPSVAYFAELAKQGYDMVVNLAPPQSHGSLPDEGGLVAEKGLIYVNIPVDWDEPSREHFEFFAKLLQDNQSRKTLVHCQVGFRASTFTFLYRAISLGQPADEALESVHEVWVPNATWTAFADAVLAANDVEFSIQHD